MELLTGEATSAVASSSALPTAEPPSKAHAPAQPRPSTRRRSPWLRRAEVLAWAVGLLLLGVWGLGRLLGTALEQRDLRRFRLALETPQPSPVGATAALPPVNAQAVDQRRWAKERIQAYAQALLQEAPTPLAVLRIPRIGLEVPVLAGTDEWTLDRAVGWIEGTGRPGEPGNVGIAGHRDGFFRGLEEVKLGDSVELVTLSKAQTFRIEGLRIVSPQDVQVLESTPVPSLTLVTCFPFYFAGSAPQRYVVRAVLANASAQSMQGAGPASK